MTSPYSRLLPVKNKMPQIEFHNILAINKTDKYFFLDVRAPIECLESPLPKCFSNIPILDNDERSHVGTIYKKNSANEATEVAYQLAIKKEKNYINLIKEMAQNRPVVVTCWRGGGRSQYVTNLLVEKGLQASQLEGGQKKFRQTICDFFSTRKFNFLVLQGLTGCGKTEILEKLTAINWPVLDLELAARHASSILGRVRYNHLPAVCSQQEFEINLYLQLLSFPENSIILCEGESRKIGPYIIPDLLYKLLLSAPSVLINAPWEERISRLKKEYLQTEEKRTQLSELLIYFKKKIPLSTILNWQYLIETKQDEIFLADILIYYDKFYKLNKSNLAAIYDYQAANFDEFTLMLKRFIEDFSCISS